MDYTEITKIEEITSFKTVNEYLALGWKIVNIYTTAYDTERPGANHQTIHYVMGWFDSEPVYPEEPSSDLLGNYI